MKGSNIVSFVIGAGVGSAICYFVLKKKFEKQFQDQVALIQEAYNEREKKLESIAKDETSLEKPMDITPEEKKHYDEIIQSYKAEETDEDDDESPYFEHYEEPEFDPIDPNKAPYPIKEENVGERSDFETIELFKYSDGTIADAYDTIVERSEYDSTFGSINLTQFGVMDEDQPSIVCVRNERLRTDYIIALVAHSYAKEVGGNA